MAERDRWARAVEGLTIGLSVAGAARYGQVPPEYLRRALRAGEQEATRRMDCEQRGEDPGPETWAYSLWQRACAAEATIEQSVVRMVHDAVLGGDVKLATWYLSRRFPTEWGPTAPRVIADEAPPDGTDTSDEALRRVLGALDRG
jgi:hypothetical protein